MERASLFKKEVESKSSLFQNNISGAGGGINNILSWNGVQSFQNRLIVPPLSCGAHMSGKSESLREGWTGGPSYSVPCSCFLACFFAGVPFIRVFPCRGDQQFEL